MKRSVLFSLALRNGLIAGVLVAALMIGLFYMGRHPLVIAPFLDFRLVVFAIFIFFTLKEFRDSYHDGVLYFWQGMLGGLTVVLVSQVVATLGLSAFSAFESDFVQEYIRLYTEFFKSFSPEEINQFGKDQFESNLKALATTNTTTLAMDYFVKIIPFALAIIIIVSVILRKQPKN